MPSTHGVSPAVLGLVHNPYAIIYLITSKFTVKTLFKIKTPIIVDFWKVLFFFFLDTKGN